MTQPRLSIALANYKPGTGKTTTSVFLAFAFHALGYEVLLVDADPAQSSLAWSDEVEGFPFKIVGLAAKDAGRRLSDYSGPETIAIVDCPQAEDHGAIVRGVLRHVDEISVTAAPTTIEVDRTGKIADLLEEVQEVRPDPARIAVLLNRVVGSARSGADARDGLASMGYDVLEATIPRRELYAQGFGLDPHVSPGDPVDQLAREYLRRAGLEAAA